MADRILEILSRLHLFRGLTPDAMEGFLPVLRPVRFEAGETLFRQGQAGRTAFIIVKGAVRIDVETPTRGCLTVATLVGGETVGEIALVDPGPRTATATALEPTACFALTTEGLKTLQEGRPDLVARVLLNLSRTISARLRTVDETLAAAMAADASAFTGRTKP
jgi:CRP-like cAMP-binding protein